MKPSARLFNLHSRKNAGDAALVQSAASVLRTLWPDISLSASTRYRDDDEWLTALGIAPRPPLVHFPTPGEGSEISRGARLAGSLVKAHARRGLRRGPARSPVSGEVSLSAGGGYLFSRGPRGLTVRHVLAEIDFSASASPTMLLPQSIGPVTNAADRRRFADALSRVSRVMVRDETSFFVATEHLRVAEGNVVRVPDLAFALPAPERPVRSGGVPRVAMTVLDWRWAGGDDEQYARYLRSLGSIAETLAEWGLDIDLLVQVDLPGRQDDGAQAKRVRERLRRPVGLHSVGHTTDEALARCASYDLMIGSRLHSALLALCAGTPALALGYQPKAAGVYEDIGLSDWVFDARAPAVDEVLRLARKLLDEPDHARARTRSAVSRAKAEIYERIGASLAPWLGPPRPPTAAPVEGRAP